MKKTCRKLINCSSIFIILSVLISFQACKLGEAKPTPEKNKKLKKIKSTQGKSGKLDEIKSSVGVSELKNPVWYSAGDMSEADVAKWVKKNIQPKLFDIWHGKSERIYLNGSWKMIKLGGTEGQPDCDYGMNHGFEKVSYNDKSWFNQPVPFPASYWIKERKKTKGEKRKVFLGVSWLRQKFNVPEKYRNKRNILCFRAIGGTESEVYVNGKKVATHKNIRIPKVGLYRCWEEKFEVDISSLIKYGAENTIAVRIYQSAISAKDGKRIPKKHILYYLLGGIWQEVYLDMRPEIYLKKALIRPVLKESSIEVKAFLVNSSNKNKEFTPTVKTLPWSSNRYKLWSGNSQTVQLKNYSLHPGENKISFNVPIKNTKLWSPEHPYLYHFQLLNKQGQIVGQERFGFRDFKCGKRYFYLNNKKIMMRGEQCLWTGYTGTPGRTKIIQEMGLVNNNRIIEKWYTNYLNMNMNLVRTHSSWYPHSFYDIADEKGALLYDELSFSLLPPFFKGKELTAFAKDKIKARAYASYNHPCVVMLSLGNEKYDQDLYERGPGDNSFAPYLDTLYKEYKKYDPYRSISSSGRLPTDKSLDKVKAGGWGISEKYAKSDFHDCHNYKMCWEDIANAESDNNWEYSFKKFYDAYALDDGGQKPMINGETNISCLPIPGFVNPKDYKDLKNEFKSNTKDGKIDREWLTKEWSVLKTKYGHGNTLYVTERAFNRIGFQNVVQPERALLEQAKFYKRLIELHRRKREYCTGFVSNNPRTFIKNTAEPLEPVYSYAKKACQPILACVSETFNRNLLAGGANYESEIYIMNDTEETVKDLTLTISLKGIDNNNEALLKTMHFKSLTPAEMQVVKFIPAPSGTLSTGHYQIILDISLNEKIISSNDYKLFLFNLKDTKLSKYDNKLKIALYRASKQLPVRTDFYKQTKKIMSELKIDFTEIENLDKVKDYELLILPPHSIEKGMTSEVFEKWLREGGKVLCLEQFELPPGIPGRLQSTGRFGFFTELIELDHPVFNKLNQQDFRYWNGNLDKLRNKWLLDRCLLPLNPGVLACLPTVSERVGISVEELKIGKGLFLASQLKVVERYKKDSVATQYMINLFNYTLGTWNEKRAYAYKDSDNKKADDKIVFKIDTKKAFSVDLKPYANMGFVDEVAHDGKGGWTDQGPNYDLRSFPVGKQVFKGIPFDIIDPSKNDNKSCIVLRGKKRSKTGFLPEKVLKIKVGKKVSKLFFLVSAAWAGKAEKFGKIRVIYYAKGTGMFGFQDIDLINGKNIADWWNPCMYELSDAVVAWTGLTKNKQKLVEVGAYLFEWKNPDQSRAIEYLEFFSELQAVPVFLAVTGEEITDKK